MHLNFYLSMVERLTLTLVFAVIGIRCDPCSWFGSGGFAFEESKSVEDPEERVQPISLFCQEGKVEWSHPIGALLVQYHIPENSETVHEFRFCLRPLRRHKDVTIYRRDKETLVPLVTNDEHTEICFDSGPTPSLFLQKTPGKHGSYSKNSISGFFYSAEPLIRKSSELLRKFECEPCRTADVLSAFCSSTFIFKGRFKGLSPRQKSGEQEMNFVIEKLIRKPIDHSEVLSRIRYTKKTKMQGSVTSPSNCDIDLKSLTATDTFLIISDMSLGRAKLVCGLLWEDWMRLRESKKIDSPCELR